MLTRSDRDLVPMVRAFSPRIFRSALLTQPATPQRRKYAFAGDPVLGWAGIATRLWRIEAARFARDFGSAGYVVAVAYLFLRLPCTMGGVQPSADLNLLDWFRRFRRSHS